MRAGILIASCDPGGSTGIANYRLSTNPSDSKQENYNGITGIEFGPEPHHKELWAYLAGQSPDLILCERYDSQENDAAKLISVEYIGVLNLYGQLTRTPIKMRARANKDVTWLKTPALKRMGCYTPGKPHMNDAKRHLIHYVVHDLKRKEILEALRR